MASEWISIKLPIGCIKKQYAKRSFIVLQGAVGDLAGYSFSCSNEMVHLGETVIVKCDPPFGVVEFPCDRIVVKRDRVITLNKGKKSTKLKGEALAHFLKDCIKDTAEQGILQTEGVGKFYHEYMMLEMTEEKLVSEFENSVSLPQQAPTETPPPSPALPRRTAKSVIKSIFCGIGRCFLKLFLALLYVVLKLVFGLAYILSLLVGEIGMILSGIVLVVTVLVFIFGEPIDGFKILGVFAAVTSLPYLAEAVIVPLDNFIDEIVEDLIE